MSRIVRYVNFYDGEGAEGGQEWRAVHSTKEQAIRMADSTSRALMAVGVRVEFDDERIHPTQGLPQNGNNDAAA